MIHASLSKFLQKRIPILSWGRQYNIETGISDMVAGITVGLTLIPQAIAYAALAGLTPQYGLYSAFAGALVYIAFGTCPEVSIGPTALVSLLTFNYTHDTNPSFAVLLCFLGGCVQVLCGVFQLGFLVEFVSLPVTVGFSSAAALIIASSQIKGLLGLSYTAENFVHIWWELYNHIGETKLWDSILSIGCCIILLTMRKLKDIKMVPSDDKTLSQRQQKIKKILWFVSVGRNAMVVVACAFLAYIFECHNMTPFILTGKIDPGLPPFAPPPFSTTIGNQTYEFTDMVSHLGSGIIVLPLICILQNIAIAKAFAKGRVVDATQEMLTIGLASIAGSFFSSYPVSGSFSRGAVNNASGVKTPMGGLYTGILVILALAFLTPYFYYIPKATLSSVLICAVIFMVEVASVKPIWRTNKLDIIPLFATFLACLVLGVELGILIGIAVDICSVLYFTARPRIVVQTINEPNSIDYILITPSSGLLFPAIDHLRAAISKSGNQNEKYPIVINCQYIKKADYTSAQGVTSLITDFNKHGRYLIFHGLEPNVAKILASECPVQIIETYKDADLLQKLKDLSTKVEDNLKTIDIRIDTSAL